MKFKISLLILLLSVFALGNLDRHHIIFHSCFATGHHSNIDKNENYFASKKQDTFLRKFSQGDHHIPNDVSVVFEKIQEEREKKSDIQDYFVYDVIIPIISFSRKIQYVERISIPLIESITKKFLLHNVFRI